MSRQAGGRAGSNGGVGLRGPGETKIETDRRRIRERMAKLRREIRGHEDRARHQARPAPSVGVPVGGDRRATRTRASRACSTRSPAPVCWCRTRCSPPWTRPPPRRPSTTAARWCSPTPSVSSGTCPTQLVEAFRSTLEEVAGADLLVHVVDGSDPMPPAARSTRCGRCSPTWRGARGRAAAGTVGGQQDRRGRSGGAGAAARGAARGRVRLGAHPRGHRRVAGSDDAAARPPTTSRSTALLPYDRGDLVARIHAEGTLVDAEHEADGTRVTARVPGALAGLLAQFGSVAPETAR